MHKTGFLIGVVMDDNDMTLELLRILKHLGDSGKRIFAALLAPNQVQFRKERRLVVTILVDLM
jgi:hypothetical protein